MPTDALTRVAVDRWAGLSGIALLLTGEPAHAEVVVRDVFVAALSRRVELRNPEAALAYLRRGVVRRARRIRGCQAAAGLDQLPRVQREALVLRVYAGASDRQTGAAVDTDEVEATVGRGLTALAATAPELHDQLTAYVADHEVTGPDLQQTASAARVQRRHRAAGSAVVALVGVAVLALGVTALARHRDGAATDAGPLPGLVPVGSVGVPAGVRIDDVDMQRGQVWALGFAGAGNRETLLHGPVGGRLARFAGSDAPPPGASVGIAVSAGVAYLVTSDDATASDHSLVTTYDATTGTQLSTDALPAGDSAALTQVVGGGATEALVVVHPDAAGSGSLTVSLLSAGHLADVRGPVVVPSSELPYGIDASDVRLVLAGGAPQRAYLSGPVGSAPVVDLDTGVTDHVVLGGGDPNGGGSSSQAVGGIDGVIVYTAQAGTFVGSPTSLTPQQVGDGSTSIEILGGRAYQSVAPTFDTLQALDPTTHLPTGPILTERGDEGGPLSLTDGDAAVESGIDGQGAGGTLTIYAAP